MAIYDELRLLQKIPDAYVTWAAYRQELTDYILAETREGASLAIFGAGPLNDFDLKKLGGHFSRICLLDRDLTGVEEAFSTQGLTEEEREKFQFKEVDFLGITDEEYRYLSDAMQHELMRYGLRTDIEQLAAYSMDLWTQVYEKANQTELDFGEETFDYVVAVGVHSQINNVAAWLWDAFSQTLGQFDGSFYQLVINENEVAIPRFQDAMLSICKEACVLGLEQESLGQPGSVQGAIQGLMDIENRIAKKQLKRQSEKELLWPLDQKNGIVHRMRVQTLQKCEIDGLE